MNAVLLDRNIITYLPRSLVLHPVTRIHISARPPTPLGDLRSFFNSAISGNCVHSERVARCWRARETQGILEEDPVASAF